MLLAPYDGKTDLRAYLAQCDHVARGNGWSVEESGIHLVAALRGVAGEVLTTMPPGGITLARLRSALHNDLEWNSRASLLKLSSVGVNISPTKRWGI